MTRNYFSNLIYSASALFKFTMFVFFALTSTSAVAQTFYRSVSASKLNLKAVSASIQSDKDIKSEGSYLLKDGSIDEIYNMKLTLPAAKLNNVIGNSKITFEQTRVMVLPIMGIVHVVGILDIDGLKTTTSFQLGFFVNSDHSITFNGTKSLKLNDLGKNFPNGEFMLTIDFVLKNNQNQLAILTAK